MFYLDEPFLINQDKIFDWYNNNEKEVVKEVIKLGVADVDHQNKHGQTLLHLYCKDNNIEMIKFIIGELATINIKDKYEKLPIDYASKKEVTIIKKMFADEEQRRINISKNSYIPF